MMKVKSVATAILAAGLVAGCSGHSSVTPQSISQHPGGTRQKKDITPSDLHAGGGGFAMQAYNGDQQPAGSATNPSQLLPTTQSVFFNYPSQTANVLYCETGSDFGKSSFTGANPAAAAADCAALGVPPTGFGGRTDPPDFAGTDVAFNASDAAAYSTNRSATQGYPAEMPTLAGPIYLAYNSGDLPGLNGAPLRLSRWTYCAISNGTVTDWNDAAITADNGGTSVSGGSSLPITFVFRNDADGTNLTLQRHLQQVCAATWLSPYNKAPYASTGRSAAWTGGTPTESWSGPTTGSFVGAFGSDAQVSTITGTQGAVGAVDGPVAEAQGLSGARLQNEASYLNVLVAPRYRYFADPTDHNALRKATNGMFVWPGQGDGGAVPSGRAACIAYVPFPTYVDPHAAKAYPIMEVSYILAYGKNNAHFADLQTLLTYIDTNSGPSPAAGTSDAVLLQSGYVPMPVGIKSYVKTMLGGTSSCVKS